MIPLTPRFSHINHILFILAIVCLATILAGVIFVAARNDNRELSMAHNAPTGATSEIDPLTKAKIAERFGELPLSFEINTGSTHPTVKFLSHGPGYDLFLTATEAVLSLQKPQPRTTDKSAARVRERSVLRLKMIGANVAPRVEGEDELPGKVNYFSGNDPAKWRRDIPTYRKVRYTNVYPGIDVVYYGNRRELEYDFIVGAGANPKLIKFRVQECGRRDKLDQ